MIPEMDYMDLMAAEGNSSALRFEDTTANGTTGGDDYTPFDSSILGKVLTALDLYFIPVLIAVGLIGKSPVRDFASGPNPFVRQASACQWLEENLRVKWPPY